MTAVKSMNHIEFLRQSTRSASRKSGLGASLASIRARAVDMSPANCRFRPPQRCCFA